MSLAPAPMWQRYCESSPDPTQATRERGRRKYCFPESGTGMWRNPVVTNDEYIWNRIAYSATGFH